MSSREFLVLLDELPARSRYKGALRGLPHGLDYEWSPDEYRDAALARQMAPLNADGDMQITRMLYQAYFSPVERKVLEAKETESQRKSQAVQSAIHTGLYARVPEEKRKPQ